MEIKRLFDYLTLHTDKRPETEFVSGKEIKANGTKEWRHYTFREVKDISDKISQLLINLGLKKEDKIAIISANRPEWNFADLGSQQIGNINVPMYPTISEADYEFIFKDANVQYAFVGDESIYKKVEPLLGRVGSLKGIFTFDRIAGADYLPEVLDRIDHIDQDEIENRKRLVDADEVVTYIYTSGTTGNPKGVMLTHNNIVSNLTSVARMLPFKEGKSLSFLPLCHSFERTVFYAYLMMNIHIYYAENLETIGDNLKEVQPFCFSTVPRLLEKVYEKIIAKGHELNGIKKAIFFWSVRVGSQYELGVDKGWWYNLKLSIARKLVFSKWLEALGNHVEFIVTGAAAMQPRLITIFCAAGIHIIEGYGLTETSPVITINRFPEQERCLGTVGLPISGVEVRLGEDGEIIARGPNIMKGYYNRPDLTAEVIDKDGWFYTGDIGVWVEHFGRKFLKITDRKKELFKTAGGKYIAPQAVENKMKESRFIEQIMVVGGDDKKYIAALIVPSFVQLRAWAEENEIALTTNEELVKNQFVNELLNKEVTRLNHSFGKWEQIKKIKLLPDEWTIDSGFLTPTLKLKRRVLADVFKNDIDALFKE